MVDTIDTKFETLVEHYDSCGQRVAAELVIKDLRAWENLWTQIYSNYSQQPVLPKINFNEEIILGVFLGERNSGGYGINISKILARDNCLEVYVTERAPEHEMVVTMALTQPFHLVKTALTSKEVKFIKDSS